MALDVAGYADHGNICDPLKQLHVAKTEAGSNNLDTSVQTDHHHGISIDYELLVSNVEHMLIADKAKFKRKIQPKDLLIKSNPALFGNMQPDITNPRDMYSFLSKRKFPKLIDDLQFERQISTFDDKLSRSNSFKDLNIHNNGKFQKKYHFHSHQDLTLMEKKDPSLAALNSNVPYVGPDEISRLPEREKTSTTNFNLPSLNQSAGEVNKEGVTEGANNVLSLPFIKSTPLDSMGGQTKNENKSGKSKDRRTKPNVSFNNKIDKWFAEMPNDVTDKADRAIMEDLIRERMAAYQNDFSLSNKFTKIRNRQSKSINQIQHQYLELRAETAPKPNRSDVNLSHFKLKQRTSINLKSELTDLGPKRHRQHDGMSSDGAKSTLNDITKPQHSLRKINLDQFAVDAYNTNPNRRFTFAEMQKVGQNKIIDDINDDTLRRRSDKEHWLRMSQPKPYPSIVNISIDKVRRDNKKTNYLKQTLSVLRMDAVNEKENEQEDSQDENRPNEDKHSECSKSSSNKHKRQHPSKTVLSKFNTLEVFGGMKNSRADPETVQKSNKYVNPLIKLDLRNSRHNVNIPKELETTAIEIIPKPQPEVDFRFGSGEVTITRKSNDDADVGVINSPNAPPNNTEYSGHSLHSENGDKNTVDDVLTLNQCTNEDFEREVNVENGQVINDLKPMK